MAQANVNPALVIVTGPPGAGKSTLARLIAPRVSLPLVSKDGIKEVLYDTLGWHDRECSQKLGHASMALVFYCIEQALAAGCSLMAEAAFIPEFHLPRLLQLRDEHPFELVQIYCTACEAELFRRVRRRWDAGQRHPGHADQAVTPEQFAASVGGGRYGPLAIGGQLVTIDTTHLTAEDVETVADQCVSLIRAQVTANLSPIGPIELDELDEPAEPTDRIE